MSFPVAKRVSAVDSGVWQWVHKASDLSPVQPVVNLGTSFIEQKPPDFLLEEHRRILDSIESNQYAPISGVTRLKKSIAETYSSSHGRTLDPEKDVLVTSGAQEGLLSCVMTFIDPGDEVILLEPVFAMYVYHIAFSGGVIKYVPLRPPKSTIHGQLRTVSGNDWYLDMAELEAAVTPKTKMILINNPQNPLGKVFSRNELFDIGNLCVKHDLILVSDEVYERVVFDEPRHCQNANPHISVASLSPAIADRTLTAISFGKLFNATGWRAGFVIGPEALIESVTKTHLILAYSTSTPTQEACILGLQMAEKTDWWSVNRKDVAARVHFLCDILTDAGLSFVMPASAWFIFVNISNLQIPEGYEFPDIVHRNGTKDWKACYFLIQEFGVSSIPGSSFYSCESAHIGQDYIRLGACKSDDGLQLAKERFARIASYVGKTSAANGHGNHSEEHE